MTANRKLTAPQRKALEYAANNETVYIGRYGELDGKTIKALVKRGLMKPAYSWDSGMYAITALGRAALGTSADAEPLPFDGGPDAGVTTRNYIVKVALRDGETKGTISVPDGLNGHDLYATLVTVAQKQFGDNFHYIRTYYDADDPGRTPYPDTWEHGTVRDAQTTIPTPQPSDDAATFDELLEIERESYGKWAIAKSDTDEWRSTELALHIARNNLCSFIEDHADTIRAALVGNASSVLSHRAQSTLDKIRRDGTAAINKEWIEEYGALELLQAGLIDWVGTHSGPHGEVMVEYALRRIDGGSVQR